MSPTTIQPVLEGMPGPEPPLRLLTRAGRDHTVPPVLAAVPISALAAGLTFVLVQ